MLHRVHLTWTGFELKMLLVIGTNYIGSYISNYHTITTTTAPLSDSSSCGASVSINIEVVSFICTRWNVHDTNPRYKVFKWIVTVRFFFLGILHQYDTLLDITWESCTLTCGRRWFSPDLMFCSTNKIDHHVITVKYRWKWR